ncbi:peroxisomal multifunctional enzyme type 2 [Elysia marginata]|uniref:Peroxisomal multifunctional enzyme type 2 n=1 Tax=Elysia marginata TaxID=1093978 RepID=A0AAV4IX08_9GAST|nr:peroxisomal multifunctional enzyme type 2 [Elysia marginata]
MSSLPGYPDGVYLQPTQKETLYSMFLETLAKAYQAAPMEFIYTERDAILYALGDFLKFLFEQSKDFCVLPTFAVIPCVDMFQENAQKIPGFKFDPAKILHGEHYLQLYKPLPHSGKLTSYFKVADVLDKGSGLVKVYNVETFNDIGEKVAFNQMLEFTVGAGNFGGRKASDIIVPVAKPPIRKPDAVMEEKTTKDQVRFVKPVLPGQTLKTEMWREEARIFFTTKVVETDEPVIGGAYIDLHESCDANIKPTSVSSLKSTNIFKQLVSSKANTMTSSVSSGNTVLQWNITHQGASAFSFAQTLNTNEIYVGASNATTPDCTISLSDEVFVDLMGGRLDVKQALANGSLRINAKTTLAQKLNNIDGEKISK